MGFRPSEMSCSEDSKTLSSYIITTSNFSHAPITQQAPC